MKAIEKKNEKTSNTDDRATTFIASRSVLGKTIAYSYRNMETLDRNVETARNRARNPKSSGEKTRDRTGEKRIGAS